MSQEDRIRAVLNTLRAQGVAFQFIPEEDQSDAAVSLSGGWQIQFAECATVLVLSRSMPNGDIVFYGEPTLSQILERTKHGTH